jgi:hypothetical protein
MLHRMSTSHQAVAASVRAELARKGVSGRQLARDLEWSPGKTQRRLAGEHPFDAGELTQIADYLGIPAAAFFPQSVAS